MFLFVLVVRVVPPLQSAPRVHGHSGRDMTGVCGPPTDPDTTNAGTIFSRRRPRWELVAALACEFVSWLLPPLPSLVL